MVPFVEAVSKIIGLIFTLGITVAGIVSALRARRRNVYAIRRGSGSEARLSKANFRRAGHHTGDCVLFLSARFAAKSTTAAWNLEFRTSRSAGQA